MQEIASAWKPCRGSCMTTLSACGCDLVMIQVCGNVTAPSPMLAPGNRSGVRRDTAVTVRADPGRTLSFDSTGVSDHMHPRERFLAALRGDALDRPPVWLMRQAGRYLPGYRALRAEHSFWDVCQNPELSTRAALEPLDRYALDAAIVFSDILVVPLAMGLGVTFGKGEGPMIAKPLRNAADYEAWQLDGVLDRIAYLPRAVAHLKQTLKDRYGILGFAGAPFTLFAYCVEGGGSDDFREARTLMHRDPGLAKRALNTIADVVADLLLAQVEAGADAVQLFDS